MRTRAIVLVAAFMMGSAAATVFAADSMKHDMQRDLHEKMGMAAGEDKNVTTTVSKTATFVRRDMQSDLQERLGYPADVNLSNSTTNAKAPADVSIYKP